MEKHKIFNKSGKTLFYTILISVIISLSFLGAECNKIINGGNGNLTDVVGNWILHSESGNLVDVCRDETIEFKTTGYADLTCPGSTPVTRKFTIQNNDLVWLDNNLTYTYQVYNSGGNKVLDLTGQGVGRHLIYYSTSAMSPKVPVKEKCNDCSNSSDKK